MTEEEFKKLDEASRKPIKFAHDFLFHDITEDVPDHFGRLLRLNDTPANRWLQWKKSVHAAHLVMRGSLAAYHYLQVHGHLALAPQEKKEETARFTWSPSKLMTWQGCPLKYAHESVYKTVPYEETIHTQWGIRVHTAAEKFMLGEPVSDPEAFAAVEKFVKLLATIPGERFIEYKISLDDNWKPAEWEGATGRMIVDLAILSPDGKTLKIYDYKTGAIKESTVQMSIYCYAMAILFPQVEQFEMKYVWIKHNKVTGFSVAKKDIVPTAHEVRSLVKRMKTDFDNDNFVMRKSGLCRQFCGVMACAYNGRRGKK